MSGELIAMDPILESVREIAFRAIAEYQKLTNTLPTEACTCWNPIRDSHATVCPWTRQQTYLKRLAVYRALEAPSGR